MLHKFFTSRTVRWFLTAIVIAFALLFWAITLTVPSYSATAPALISIALSALVYFVWPKRNKKIPKTERYD